MMYRLYLVLLFFALSNPLFAQTDPKKTEVWEPEPPIVTINDHGRPSDAIVLFDGNGLDAWEHGKKPGEPVAWTTTEDFFMVKPGTGGISTKQKFGDVQLHLEWSAPTKIEGKGQGRGNSGVFFCDGKYEVQILDSYNNRTYSNGQAASVYKQHIPLVNATRPPGEWQTYDIIFHMPRFGKDGKKVKPGYFTVLHNGVLVQNHVEIKGTTEYRGAPRNIPHAAGSIFLQDHSNPVRFRNIWVRPLQ